MKFYMYKYDGKLLPIVTLLFGDDRVSTVNSEILLFYSVDMVTIHKNFIFVNSVKRHICDVTIRNYTGGKLRNYNEIVLT